MSKVKEQISVDQLWFSVIYNGVTKRKNRYLAAEKTKDMGAGGRTFNGHVLSKHVPHLTGDSVLRRGIAELLSRWGGLQMAVKNQWGGNDSLKKYQELAHHLFHLFSQSNATITVEEIENFLHESLLLSFNTEIEDGSIEEVAEQLIILHEEYFRGNH